MAMKFKIMFLQTASNISQPSTKFSLLLLLFIFQIVYVKCYVDKQYNYQIRTICGTSTLT